MFLIEATNGLSGDFASWGNMTAIGAIIAILCLIVWNIPKLHRELRDEREQKDAAFLKAMDAKDEKFVAALQAQRTEFRAELTQNRQETRDLVRDVLALRGDKAP